MAEDIKKIVGIGEHVERPKAVRRALENWQVKVLEAFPDYDVSSVIFDEKVQINYQKWNPDILYYYIVTLTWAADCNK